MTSPTILPSGRPLALDAFPGVRPLLRDLVRFILRPTPAERQMGWGWPLLAIIAVLILLDLALSLGVVGLISGAEALGYEPPPFVDPDIPRPWLLFIAIILAPIAEESTFRGWLSGRRPALVLAASCIGGFAAIMLVDLFIPSALGVTGAVALVAVAAASIYWLALWHDQGGILPLFRRHYALIVWLSSLLFGAVHLTNYDSVRGVVDILVVLPQTLGGLLLAYSRTRLGLRAAILHHGAFNAIVLAIEPFF